MWIMTKNIFDISIQFSQILKIDTFSCHLWLPLSVTRGIWWFKFPKFLQFRYQIIHIKSIHLYLGSPTPFINFKFYRESTHFVEINGEMHFKHYKYWFLLNIMITFLNKVINVTQNLQESHTHHSHQQPTVS